MASMNGNGYAPALTLDPNPASYDPGYEGYKEQREPYEALLRTMGTAVPATTDLRDRLREIGGKLVSLERPCAAVVEDPYSEDCTKNLAQTMLDGMNAVAEELAVLLVDLSQTADVVSILKGTSS